MSFTPTGPAFYTYGPSPAFVDLCYIECLASWYAILAILNIARHLDSYQICYSYATIIFLSVVLCLPLLLSIYLSLSLCPSLSCLLCVSPTPSLAFWGFFLWKTIPFSLFPFPLLFLSSFSRSLFLSLPFCWLVHPSIGPSVGWSDRINCSEHATYGNWPCLTPN